MNMRGPAVTVLFWNTVGDPYSVDSGCISYQPTPSGYDFTVFMETGGIRHETWATEGIWWIKGHHAEGSAEVKALIAANALAFGHELAQLRMRVPR